MRATRDDGVLALHLVWFGLLILQYDIRVVFDAALLLRECAGRMPGGVTNMLGDDANIVHGPIQK